ncbi:putative formimidoyltransferase-cyclodeaminase, partial [Apostichopus japonicus]
IACQLVDKIDGFSCFLFGSADEEKKSLVDRRKEIGWFRDIQVLTTSLELLIWVQNVKDLELLDLAVGRRIAKAIRGTSPGGLNGVQAMAFPHRGNIEVACNVESYQTTAEENEKSVSNPRQTTEQIGCESTENTEAIRKEWIYSSPQTIEQRVAELARNEGIELVGTALVGFTPDKAYELAIKNLREGNSERWKTQKVEHM